MNAGFDAKNEEYPEDPKAFDGVLISGSLSGVYEKDAWIKRLLQVPFRSIEDVMNVVNGHQSPADG